MSARYEKFRSWCNTNANVFGFLIAFLTGILVLDIAISAFKKIPISQSFWHQLSSFFLVPVMMPLYILLLLCLAFLALFLIMQRRFKRSIFYQSQLIGIWKNEWGPPHSGYEVAEIKADLKYFVNGVHFFTLEQFSFDPKLNEISFWKVGVRDIDRRRVLNKLKVENNDFLKGTEKNYPIKYTRQS